MINEKHLIRVLNRLNQAVAVSHSLLTPTDDTWNKEFHLISEQIARAFPIEYSDEGPGAVDSISLSADVSYFAEEMMENYGQLLPIGLSNMIFRLIDSITTTEERMHIDTAKLKEVLHEIRVVVGAFLNASEEKMKEAAEKVESIFLDSNATDDPTLEVAPAADTAEIPATANSSTDPVTATGDTSDAAATLGDTVEPSTPVSAQATEVAPVSDTAENTQPATAIAEPVQEPTA